MAARRCSAPAARRRSTSNAGGAPPADTRCRRRRRLRPIYSPPPPPRQERCALLEAVAYDCQLSHQPEEARELFMAARRPRAALHIVNQQLSAALHESKGVRARAPAAPGLCLASRAPPLRGALGRGPLQWRPAASSRCARALLPPAAAAGAMDPSLQALIERGQAAVEAMGSAAADDPQSRREAEAFQQLCLARRLFELAASQQWDAALQVRCGCRAPRRARGRGPPACRVAAPHAVPRPPPAAQPPPPPRLPHPRRPPAARSSPS
jgi:hypothetical protein